MPQVWTCGIMWIFWEKTFIFKYQKCDRSGPVKLCEKMLEFIKCATGPDLSNYVKKCKNISNMPQVHTCGIMWKNARIYKMCHISGPVELCKKMLEYIKCATGPDLWNYVNILRKNFYFWISKVRQVRTCGIMWKNAGIYKVCHRSGPVELCEKMLEFIKCATGPDLWNYVKKF